jgi:hypothetical protein
MSNVIEFSKLKMKFITQKFRTEAFALSKTSIEDLDSPCITDLIFDAFFRVITNEDDGLTTMPVFMLEWPRAPHYKAIDIFMGSRHQLMLHGHSWGTSKEAHLAKCDVPILDVRIRAVSRNVERLGKESKCEDFLPKHSFNEFSDIWMEAFKFAQNANRLWSQWEIAVLAFVHELVVRSGAYVITSVEHHADTKVLLVSLQGERRAIVIGQCYGKLYEIDKQLNEYFEKNPPVEA